MERREFLIKGCTLCIGGFAISALLQGCGALPIYKTQSQNHRLTIPMEKLGENNFLIIRPSEVNYDVALIRTPGKNLRSFVMICTHADNPVTFNGKEFSCNLHGSIFNNNGDVVNGPAGRSLVSLNTTVEGDQVIIKLI